MSLMDLILAWDRFWFSRVAANALCLYRILFGLLTLVTALLLAPDLYTWFGAHPLLSITSVQAWEHHTPRFSLFFLLPESDALASAVWCLLVLSSICVMVGVKSRLSAFLVYLCLLSFHQRIPCIFHSGDTILRQQAFLLMFAPSGVMYSFDSKWNTTPVRVSYWTQRMLQLQLCVVYFGSFCNKFDSPQWLDGTAIYYVARIHELARLPVPFLFDQFFICQFFTYGTLVIEFALFSLIWIKELRYPVLIVGVLLHLAIDWSLNLPVFEYVMICSYVLFVAPEHIEILREKMGTFLQKKDAPLVSHS